MQPIETTPAFDGSHWTRIWLRRRQRLRLVFQFLAFMMSVVDAPRLVSSDTSPTRAEWAVTGPTPAARAAAWNRSLTIWGESGTTRSSGTGRAAACSVRRAPATSPFTNRTSRGAGFVLPRRTVTSTPSLAGRLGDVAPEEGAHLATPQPRDEEQHRRASGATFVGLDAAAAATWPVAGGEDRGQVRRYERVRLAPTATAGGPPVARQHSWSSAR